MKKKSGGPEPSIALTVLHHCLRPLNLQGRCRWTAGRFAKVFRVLDDIVDGRLADVSSSAKHVRGDFLDALLELLSAGKITRDTVTTIMFDVFAAGSDTIAITVEWAMAELHAAPPKHHGQGTGGDRGRPRRQGSRRGARRGGLAVPSGRGEGGDAAAPGGAAAAALPGRGGRRRDRRLHRAQGLHRDLQRLGHNAGPGGVGEARRLRPGAVLG
ncbi:hypothetical protein PAHAL_6G231200 [Panicum hallii]|uniref:Uncharacterized protein n=1 Tax=Panicum hallii TaxID=206008 RepID=A0A2T8IHA3_9POAL|nr:hypothetical protein PAHAL_6G231200 [Panicum hallii]